MRETEFIVCYAIIWRFWGSIHTVEQLSFIAPIITIFIQKFTKDPSFHWPYTRYANEEYYLITTLDRWFHWITKSSNKNSHEPAWSHPFTTNVINFTMHPFIR